MNFNLCWMAVVDMEVVLVTMAQAEVEVLVGGEMAGGATSGETGRIGGEIPDALAVWISCTSCPAACV